MGTSLRLAALLAPLLVACGGSTTAAPPSTADVVTATDVVDAAAPADIIDAATTDAPDVVTADTPDVVTSDTPDVVTFDTPDVVTSDTPDVVTSDTTDVVTSDTPDVVTSDTPDVVTSDTPDVVDVRTDVPPGSSLTWDPSTADSLTELSGGNLSISGTASRCAAGVRATGTRATGRWYWEHRAMRDGGSNDTGCPVGIGISSPDGSTRAAFYGHHGDHSFLTSGGASCTLAGVAAPVSTGDVLGVAWDVDARTVDFYLNGRRVSSCTVPAGTYYPYGSHCNDAFHHCAGITNFGAAHFAWAPPAGFTAIP